MSNFGRTLLRLIPLLPVAFVMPAVVLPPVSARPSPEWIRVAEHANWKPRDSCGEVVFRGRMWIMGGWFDSFQEPPRDVWSSADGVMWERVTEQAPWKHSDLPTTLVFKDRMWMMGGWHNGRLPGASASNEVWSSRDGAVWELATDSAGWSPRLGAAGVVFKGKMWILGGVERYYDGMDRDLRSDVWHSTDGKHWKLATAQAPWTPRAYHAAVAFGNKLWIFGGGNYVPRYEGHNDVWSSPDGVTWTRVTEHAPWPARIWFSGAGYRNRIWMLGGWSNHPFRNWNDVWHTTDGSHWKELKTVAVWPERHEHSAYVFRERLWVTGGNVPPLVNDVWSLELPRE
jgi:hypothetical protein